MVLQRLLPETLMVMGSSVDQVEIDGLDHYRYAHTRFTHNYPCGPMCRGFGLVPFPAGALGHHNVGNILRPPLSREMSYVGWS